MSYATFTFNTTLKDKESNYITLPPMDKFCGVHKIMHPSTYGDTLDAIQAFARLNSDNYNCVLDWGEVVLKQGIKQLYATPIIFADIILSIIKNPDSCKKHISELFSECKQTPLLICDLISRNLVLQNIYISQNEETNSVENISFYFSIRLLEGSIAEIGSPFFYPIFVDLDLNKNLIVARAKPKSQMFLCNADDDVVLELNRTDIKKIIQLAIDYIKEKLSFDMSSKKAMNTHYKNAIYNFLTTLTFTPECIKSEILSYNDKIDTFINEFFLDKDIPNTFAEKAKADMEIFIEKYLSISVPVDNQGIFECDRDGYPTDISTTDHEQCKLREISSDKTPLQTKEVYFDNKKSLNRQRSCDIVRLYYNRISSKYYGNDPFFLVLDSDNGFLRLSFRQYVEEEDIQNVLCKILELTEVQ